MNKLILENAHLKELIAEKEAEIQSLEETVDILTEKLKLALARKYARSSERFTPTGVQDQIFDEEALEEEKEEAPEEEQNIESTSAQNLEALESPGEEKGDLPLFLDPGEKLQEPLPRERKKRTARLPSYLPSTQKHHILSPEELLTADGLQFTKIGEITSRELIFIPEQLMVIHHIRHQYACKEREELGILTAPGPRRPFAGGFASASLMAHVMTQKYAFHLPLYRQEENFKQLEIPLKRGTMGHWILKGAEILEPLVEVLKETLQQQSYLHADETPVTVLTHSHSVKNGEKPKGDKNSRTGYMWLYGSSLSNLVYYEYQETRGGEHPRKFFQGFKGHAQADAYGGYDGVFKNPDIKEVGCMAHARRYFMECFKSQKNHPFAGYVIKEIQKLYLVERQIKEQDLASDLGFDQIQKIREEKSKPILTDLKAWIDKVQLKTAPKSSFGKALAYVQRNWVALIEYTLHGHLNIDNNFAENAIRPFALGRKNWLFSGNHKGAKASATIYTIIQNAKMHGLKIHEYLTYLLENMQFIKTKEELQALLPHRINLPNLKLTPP
jgi:transposase